MALFGSDKNVSMSKQTQPTSPNQINMIGEGTVFEGTFQARSDVRISGRVVGKVQSDGKVIVAQEGVIEGEVVAASADVAGQIQGDVRITDRLVLKSSARVEGNIWTGRLVMEEGATFDGKCVMTEQRAGGSVHLLSSGAQNTASAAS